MRSGAKPHSLKEEGRYRHEIMQITFIRTSVVSLTLLSRKGANLCQGMIIPAECKVDWRAEGFHEYIFERAKPAEQLIWG